MWPWRCPNTSSGRGRRPSGSGGVSPPSWGPKSFEGRQRRSKPRSRQSSTGPWSACPANCRPSCSPRTTMSTTNEPAASPLHRQEFGGRKKRLGDYSFVSDVISVAVLFDLPCPVRAHQSLPLLSSTTSWPPGPFSNGPPQPHPSTHPPPAHKHAFTFFLSELFRSLSLSVTDTKGTNTNDEQKVNNSAECNSGGSLSKRETGKEKRRWKRSVVCKCQEDTQRNVFFCPCGRQLSEVKSSLHERIHST